MASRNSRSVANTPRNLRLLTTTAFLLICTGMLSCEKSDTDQDLRPQEERLVEKYKNKIQIASEANRDSRAMLRTWFERKDVSRVFRRLMTSETYSSNLNIPAFVGTQQLLKEQPGDTREQALLTNILFEEGFIDSARTNLNRYLLVMPKDKYLLTSMLNMYASEENGIEEFLKAFTEPSDGDYAPWFYRRGLMYMRSGRFEEAFEDFCKSVELFQPSLGNSVYKHLATLCRSKGWSLVDRYFYYLYRPSENPRVIENLYSFAEVQEQIKVLSSDLHISLEDFDHVRIAYKVRLSVESENGSLVIPFALPPFDVDDLSAELTPERKTTVTQRRCGYTALLTFNCDPPLRKGEAVAIHAKTIGRISPSGDEPWVWFDYRVPWPFQLQVTAKKGFHIDIKSVKRENYADKSELTIVGGRHTARIAPVKDKTLFIPSLSFGKDVLVAWLANKVFSISLTLVICALIFSLFLAKRPAMGFRWCLFGGFLLYGVWVVFGFIPGRWIPDLPEYVLSPVASPSTGCSQVYVTILLAVVSIGAAILAAWVMSIHRKNFQVKGERLLIVFMPTALPLGLATLLLMITLKLMISTVGWSLNSVLITLTGIVLAGAALTILRQSSEKIRYYLLGMIIGTLLFWLTRLLPATILFVDILFLLATSMIICSVWIRRRHLSRFLPERPPEDQPFIDKLETSLAGFFEKHYVLLKLALIVSGIVAFISSIMGILKSSP